MRWGAVIDIIVHFYTTKRWNFIYFNNSIIQLMYNKQHFHVGPWGIKSFSAISTIQYSCMPITTAICLKYYSLNSLMLKVPHTLGNVLPCVFSKVALLLSCFNKLPRIELISIWGNMLPANIKGYSGDTTGIYI